MCIGTYLNYEIIDGQGLVNQMPLYLDWQTPGF